MSGPIDKGSSEFQRSLSLGRFALRSKSRKGALIRGLKRAISKTISRGQNSIVAPIKGVVSIKAEENLNFGSVNLSSGGSIDEAELLESQNLEWAQGKAGEDRVHVVVSEEHGWVFVGIYDGFNGPDAPDFLLSNLYSAVQKELKGLLWEDKSECVPNITPDASSQITNFDINVDNDLSRNRSSDSCSPSFEQENVIPHLNSVRKYGKNSKSRYRGVSRKWDDNQRWKCEWGRERLELDRRLKEYFDQSGSNKFDGVKHSDVLKALSRALKKTEETYLETADKMLDENPELALMGSCVLVMLMKGEDVYLMNVGDSRAVLARKHEPDTWLAKITQDLERINEETLNDLESLDGDDSNIVATLNAVQLTVDHSTSVEEEVQRIKNEHPDDAFAVLNGRVKGSLKVTRAFGAGFLKQPKWNNALLEMFRIDYVGLSPYISCLPSLCHHRLGPKDRFLVLSSDGLYQYFTNEEAVSEVELFIALQPEGDPAQHLVEEVLFRAARKAGMDFHDLLEIPQGDRRKYHDDVSIIVISLEGRIWKSCV